MTAAQNASVDKAWIGGHDRLAALSRRGSNTIVPVSAHYIEIDQPAAVIAAIRKAIT